jgi:hypothetical protein
MNTILLQPSDVLFFRDGRPMSGSLAGHGAAWPLPNVMNAAFHAALHRSGFGVEAHSHRRGSRGVYAGDAVRDRKFGSLKTAGPFPVDISLLSRPEEAWFFPRPLDLQDSTLKPALTPTAGFDSVQSSLPDPLEYAVANLLPPSKENAPKAWLSRAAFERYLAGTGGNIADGEVCDDRDFADIEHSIGIGIALTGTTGTKEAEGKIYSAHYLRLRDSWRLGVCAVAEDKAFNHAAHGNDLVRALLNGGARQIIVGGQQRLCSACRVETKTLPLPCGRFNGFNQHHSKHLVKWVLLSPAVWPEIQADTTRNIRPHSGGWLPNWISAENGEVLLRTAEESRRKGESREDWRRRVRGTPSIQATLVAALVPKPAAVTGWSLPDEAFGEKGGAQSTHLAVPAGAVYYFETPSPEAASQLAAALNWHGADSSPTTIRNRRSALLGEKGFGLGVCGTWNFYGEGSP